MMMTTEQRPTTKNRARSDTSQPGDTMHATQSPLSTSPTPIPTVPVLALRYTCSHCTGIGTTADGALWRVSLAADGLYYLHSACCTPYKAAHQLRAVEGRLPR